MISFAITTHNEGKYIDDLLSQVVTYAVNHNDEVVILDDNSDDEETLRILNEWSASYPDHISYYRDQLNGDFAAYKNILNSYCAEEYIFQLDADETLNPVLLTNLRQLLVDNHAVELFFLPRVNIVHGITQDDIDRWGWSINELGWNCWPDYQGRLYKNKPYIKWEGKVHERITGHRVCTILPADEKYAIYHIKDIERQRKQNDFYSSIQNIPVTSLE